MDDFKPYELRDLEEEARTKARALLEEAVAERTLRFEAARVEGFARGLEEGRAEAVRAARAEAARQAEEAAAALRAAAAALEADRAALVAAGERSLLRLAVALAGKIVRAELACGSRLAQASLRRALELAARRSEVRALVHPDDAAACDAILPELRKSFADLGTIALEPDPAVGRGGCILATPGGAVDASLARQLDTIERELLG
jgi:flagellar assembly protein FliH